MERLYGEHVGSSLDLIRKHIVKHDLKLSPIEYLTIGDSLTKGNQGKFSGFYNNHIYTVAVEGRVCEPDSNGNTKIFGLLRSVRKGA